MKNMTPSEHGGEVPQQRARIEQTSLADVFARLANPPAFETNVAIPKPAEVVEKPPADIIKADVYERPKAPESLRKTEATIRKASGVVAGAFADGTAGLYKRFLYKKDTVGLPWTPEREKYMKKKAEKRHEIVTRNEARIENAIFEKLAWPKNAPASVGKIEIGAASAGIAGVTEALMGHPNHVVQGVAVTLGTFLATRGANEIRANLAVSVSEIRESNNRSKKGKVEERARKFERKIVDIHDALRMDPADKDRAILQQKAAHLVHRRNKMLAPYRKQAV